MAATMVTGLKADKTGGRPGKKHCSGIGVNRANVAWDSLTKKTQKASPLLNLNLGLELTHSQ